MKSLTFALICIFLISGGCVEPEEELVYATCPEFNFANPARDWIMLLPGPDYVLRSGGKTRKINSTYSLSEPYVISAKPNSIEELQDRCGGQYSSRHVAGDGFLYMSNDVHSSSTLPWGNMVVLIQGLGFELSLINDTLTAKRWNTTLEKPDKHFYQNIPNLKIGEKEYAEVFKITQLDSATQPKEIYLAKRQGLVGLTISDSLWVVEW